MQIAPEPTSNSFPQCLARKFHFPKHSTLGDTDVPCGTVKAVLISPFIINEFM